MKHRIRQPGLKDKSLVTKDGTYVLISYDEVWEE